MRERERELALVYPAGFDQTRRPAVKQQTGMKRTRIVLIRAVALLAGLAANTGLSAAGVVIEQQVTQGKSATAESQTLMVQRNKEKWISGPSTVVTDLDSGLMTVSNTSAKVFGQRPLVMDFSALGSTRPRPQSPGHPTERLTRLDPEQPMALLLALKYKKTGNQQKIAGYQCEDYVGASHLAQGDYSVKACFSTGAPGAAEFTAFMRKLAASYPNLADTKKLPAGIPLGFESTMKRRPIALPSWMPPEQLVQAKAILAKPVVKKTVVTSVVSRELAAGTFELPADYQRIGMPPPRPRATPRAPAAGTTPSLLKPAPGAESKPNEQPN